MAGRDSLREDRERAKQDSEMGWREVESLRVPEREMKGQESMREERQELATGGREVESLKEEGQGGAVIEGRWKEEMETAWQGEGQTMREGEKTASQAEGQTAKEEMKKAGLGSERQAERPKKKKVAKRLKVVTTV